MTVNLCAYHPTSILIVFFPENSKRAPSGALLLLTNPDDAMLDGEDRQKSKASAPGMGLRRLYCLPILSVLSTLSITSERHQAVRSLTYHLFNLAGEPRHPLQWLQPQFAQVNSIPNQPVPVLACRRVR
ncbi:Yersinia protein of uncharacterised function (DUF3831) [Yersinia pekkanenii]|uniref:Yersinia protein of uncharacterized function (DUF3831) n=1 Tax=Yersinia pekkanenii TaxID=1288385 RepID=A0A0T9PSQ2_9GAMM|nr:Yersinia protein of uncharacterised function (DUF3831) [Yersinia pekkanenii]CRY67395.1 Yersinia protein of uncharacterised function (DUF3831) [Yersinia pekkanenii]